MSCQQEGSLGKDESKGCTMYTQWRDLMLEGTPTNKLLNVKKNYFNGFSNERKVKYFQFELPFFKILFAQFFVGPPYYYLLHYYE